MLRTPIANLFRLGNSVFNKWQHLLFFGLSKSCRIISQNLKIVAMTRNTQIHGGRGNIRGGSREVYVWWRY